MWIFYVLGGVAIGVGACYLWAAWYFKDMMG